MGRYRNARTRTTKNKEGKKHHDTKRRRRDIDQIQDELEKAAETGVAKTFEPDDDLPGMGQHYCPECARHFDNALTLKVHKTTKVHKRRLKDVAQPKYTHNEALMGAGKTIEQLPPAHPVN